MKDASIFCSTAYVALELQLNIYSSRRWASSRNRECRGHHHCSLGKWTCPLDQREKELMGEEDMKENLNPKKGCKYNMVLNSIEFLQLMLVGMFVTLISRIGGSIIFLILKDKARFRRPQKNYIISIFIISPY